MSVISLRKETQLDIKQNIEQLRVELNCCVSVQGEVRTMIEDFLIQKNIFSLSELDSGADSLFARYLREHQICNRAKIKTCMHALKKLKKEHQSLQYAALLSEIEECSLGKAVKNKVVAFLMDHDVKSLSEIDCELRQRYVEYLENTIAKSKVLEYTKALDRLKLHEIKKWEKEHPLQKPRLKFAEETIYLSYYPVYEIAASFYYIQDKQALFWDFGMEAPCKLKRQVFHMLIYAVENIKDTKDCKVRFLLPLQWLYIHCVEQGIEDIEQLESWQIEGFRKVVDIKVANVCNSMQIVDNIRKRLFLDADTTNWDANVWYLERFSLQRERMNPSNPVVRLSFAEVGNKENRRLLQKYIKYQIGISNWSISSIRQRCYYIQEFLKYLDNIGIKIVEVDANTMEDYFRTVEERDILPETFNAKVTSIFLFFRFLRLKEDIQKVPFFIEYYLKGTIPVHHNRSVAQDTVKKVLQNLYRFPLKLRLMYLNLWCIGLRISEVCTLKGDAYYWKDDAAWIKVYQNKMRAEKCIPIPTVLYRLMVNHIEKNNIASNEYVFKSAKGKAYSAGTFTKQMIENLNQCGIFCEEYNFQTHDYRHTVATFLYSHGASLQAVRDYLGHKDEEMTMQYIDYMPNMIEKANEKYFDKPENNLAAHLNKKKGSEKHGK